MLNTLIVIFMILESALIVLVVSEAKKDSFHSWNTLTLFSVAWNLCHFAAILGIVAAL